MMSEITKQANDAMLVKTQQQGEVREAKTSYDIARMTLSIAGMADPTGALSVAAAYTYPICSAGSGDGDRRGLLEGFNTRGVEIIPRGCDAADPEYQDGLAMRPVPAA